MNKFDLVRSGPVNGAMFVRDSSAPVAGQLEAERLGLPDSDKRFGKDGLHQIEETKRGPAVILDPVTKVLAKLA
ncbi:MAG TPA: hypothetical protein VMU71_09235 [Terracidiphilus sp.]|nr:hypothetical protein [Terracidiphilus sp.]